MAAELGQFEDETVSGLPLYTQKDYSTFAATMLRDDQSGKQVFLPSIPASGSGSKRIGLLITNNRNPGLLIYHLPPG